MAKVINLDLLKKLWQRVNDCNQAPCSWWHPPQKILEFDNTEEWLRQHDDVSKTLRRIMLTLLGYCLFCLFALGTPDAQLLHGSATIKMPFAGTEISYKGFLLFGPVILIAISIYLHIFLGYWHKITNRVQPETLPFVFNLNTRSARFLTTFIFYWLPYLMLNIFMAKAWPRPEGFLLSVLTAIVGLVLVILFIRRNHIRLRKTKIGKLLHVVLWTVCLLSVSDIFRLGFLTERNQFYEFVAKKRPLNLERANLSKQYLEGVRFKNALIINANFHEANLRTAVFDEAKGFEVIFTKANMQKASFVNSKVGSSNFDDAVLTGVNMKHAKLYGSSFRRVQLRNANLSYANLADAKLNKAALQDAQLVKTDLAGSDLTNANFQEANLSGARLVSANLHGTILTSADLNKTNLLEAKNLNCKQLKSAKNWEYSYRDKKLACGEKVPKPIPSLKNPPFYSEKF